MRFTKVKKVLIIAIFFIIIICKNYSIAFDYSKPYESNKNYCFSVEDANCEE